MSEYDTRLQLESAIAMQEALRPMLGDARVDPVIVALRAQIDSLTPPPSTSALVAQLDLLAAADLIRVVPSSSEPAYVFKHALVQEAAYQSLLLNDRRAIHLRIAVFLEAHASEYPDDLDSLLSYHFALAGADEQTVEHAIRAGEGAARKFAYLEATIHYARALDALQRLSDTEGHRQQRVDSIARHVELGFGSTPPERQLVQLAEAESLARSLRGPGETVGDPVRLARVHTMMAAMTLARNDYREASVYARQVLAEAARLDNPQLKLTPSAQMGAILLLQGHFAAATPFLEQSLTLLGDDVARWEWAWSVSFLALSKAMRGQIAAASIDCERAAERMRSTHNAVGTMQCLTNVLAVHLEADDLPRLLEASTQAIAGSKETGNPLFAAIGQGFQALAFSRLGQHALARRRMMDSRAIGAGMGGQFMMSDWLGAFEAEIALNAGELEGALAAAKSAVKLAQQCGDIFAEGWAHRVWGQSLGRQEPDQHMEATAHLERALQLFESGEAVLEAARTQIALGQQAAALGDDREAGQHFAAANERFQLSGLSAVP